MWFLVTGALLSGFTMSPECLDRIISLYVSAVRPFSLCNPISWGRRSSPAQNPVAGIIFFFLFFELVSDKAISSFFTLVMLSSHRAPARESSSQPACENVNHSSPFLSSTGSVSAFCTLIMWHCIN